MVFCSFIDIISVTAGVITIIVGLIAIYEFLIKRKSRECKIIIILHNIIYYLNISESEENPHYSEEKIKEYAKKFNYYYSKYNHIKYFVKRMNLPEMEGLSTDKEFYHFFRHIPSVDLLELVNIYSFNYKFGLATLVSSMFNRIIKITSHLLYFIFSFLKMILTLIKGIFYALYSSKKEAFIFIILFISSIFAIYIASDFNRIYKLLNDIIEIISLFTGPLAGDGL